MGDVEMRCFGWQAECLLLSMAFKSEPAKSEVHALEALIPQPLEVMTDDPLEVEFGISVNYDDESKKTSTSTGSPRHLLPTIRGSR